MHQAQGKFKKYNYLSSEISALYHDAAAATGISDSVQSILYIICANGEQSLQRDIYKLSGISRQTINSAIRRLEQDGIAYLEQGQGRNTIVCLTPKGKAFAAEKIYPLFEIEDKVFDEWTPEEQQEYLRLTEKYRNGLKKHLATLIP